MFNTAIKKKRAIGLVFFVILLTLFLSLNRVPKLDTVRGDLDAVSGDKVECFQGFCIEAEPDSSLLSRWWDFSLTYLRLVTVGMIFAFLVGGLTEVFLFPQFHRHTLSGRGIKGALKGLFVGTPMTLCSACIVPISIAFRKKGAGISTTLSIIQGSSTLNLPALVMVAMIFAPMLGGSRIVLSVVGALVIGPLVAVIVGEKQREPNDEDSPVELSGGDSSWREVLTLGLREWAKASLGYLIRLGPIMIVAGFASGLAIQWINPEVVETYLGNNAWGIIIAATLGILINVPLLFEIPLVVALLIIGMGTAPAAALLFTAAAGGPITYWGISKVLPKRAIAVFATATLTLGIIGGVAVLFLGPLISGDQIGLGSGMVSARERNGTSSTGNASQPTGSLSSATSGTEGGNHELPSKRTVSYKTVKPELSEPEITPFTNIAIELLVDDYVLWNDRPGVAIFDYDRDGDLDFYLTSDVGHSNFLYRNDGNRTFVNVTAEAGVAALESNSSGVTACDINNDGFQDLYVGSHGIDLDKLDFRSALGGDKSAKELKKAITDRLFLNNQDGTFSEITDSAFGQNVNYRSAMSIACGDVDADGWVDIYVGNLGDPDYRTFDSENHPGHYNLLYRNNGNLTFTEIAEQAGVKGSQILMRYPDGQPILFEDPETGRLYEGFDPAFTDSLGNMVGDPTGQTHAVMFFDHDDDGDPDLWLANDGDRLHVFRNDSTPGNVRFAPVERAMGIDKLGAWMGFAVGDYDGDTDLDVFITNMGFHPRTRAWREKPGGTCDYHGRFEWATCLHYLLRNNATNQHPNATLREMFHDVAPSTRVKPSPIMPPASLDPSNIHPSQDVPTGLAAYDFGFGATFFDYDNDADQDLYWLGSAIARGNGPGGQVFPSAGRMLQGNGQGEFEDITVRAHLLDIIGADYEGYESNIPNRNPTALKFNPKFHENGKGLAHGDLDGDGYVDLIGTNSSGPVWDGSVESISPGKGPIFMWMNGGGENHWITLRLQGRMAIDGTGSNADGIGARVYLTTYANGEDEPHVQVQEVRAGSSYLSMDSIDLEFGLGPATEVDEITIFWPSGRKQVLNGIPADQVMEITEPAQ